MSGIKKAIILCICLTMICSSSLVVLATSDPFKVEWSQFYATKQNGSDPDGLKANRTRAIQALIRECTDEQIHQGIIVDGSFGSNTKAAVQRFQTSVGLDPDGSVGPATWPEPIPLPTSPPATIPSRWKRRIIRAWKRPCRCPGP